MDDWLIDIFRHSIQRIITSSQTNYVIRWSDPDTSTRHLSRTRAIMKRLDSRFWITWSARMNQKRYANLWTHACVTDARESHLSNYSVSTILYKQYALGDHLHTTDWRESIEMPPSIPSHHVQFLTFLTWRGKNSSSAITESSRKVRLETKLEVLRFILIYNSEPSRHCCTYIRARHLRV